MKTVSPSTARGRPRKAEDGEEARRGVNALDHALVLLKALSEFRGPATLSEIARASGMPPTKAHRYLASFIAADLVSQPVRSGQYDLGPAALQLGFAAISRIDIVNSVAGRLATLTEATDCTALLSVWSTLGPVIVRWERAASYIVTNLGLGTVFPLLSSATGQVFLAHLPDRLTARLLSEEAADADPAEITAIKRRTRAQGWATVDGSLIPGLRAASAPVLNGQGEIDCAVTLISARAGAIDAMGPALPALRTFVRQFSAPTG